MYDDPISVKNFDYLTVVLGGLMQAGKTLCPDWMILVCQGTDQLTNMEQSKYIRHFFLKISSLSNMTHTKPSNAEYSQLQVQLKLMHNTLAYAGFHANGLLFLQGTEWWN